MNDLRALIRDLLSEEIAALRAEILGGTQAERVAVGNEAELTAFALNIARRAQDPGFVSALEAGRIRYAPAHTAAYAPALVPAAAPRAAPPAALVATVPPSVPELRKGLITERDIAAVPEGEPRLRITKTARLTPLAGDEARRRGIRIERTLA
ncbi:hypothetical protein [Pseudogemmobacter humi]|uniref:Uncharacterized protein n=1 Tax=Pseudogemmobacter humi TaxID=2483812 RepID=A0A3P5WQP0_9RHOB|nr:hypothetical protein [Pseudogemmobacter humi]VDC23392.1 hypothetical protein XINFAN_01024 [Pseudogemmobacter humi]